MRSIGSDLHMDYTAVGQTTHLAARMEQLADPGRDRSSTADTLALAEGFVEVTPLGPVPVKGLAAARRGLRDDRGGPARSRLQAAAARGLTRFVGPRAELEQLRQALEQRCRQATARSWPSSASRASVSRASSGSSPTRTATQGWLVLRGQLGLVWQGDAYLPVIDLLKDYFEIQDRDDRADHPREGDGQAC